MKLYEFIKYKLADLNIPQVKKEIVLNLIHSYNLKEATVVLDSCINENSPKDSEPILSLMNEIDKHIQMFNDDFEEDEIIYTD